MPFLTVATDAVLTFISSYFNNNPEAIHFLMFLFSDRSTPVDFQHADIFSVNTYRFTKTVRQRHEAYIV